MEAALKKESILTLLSENKPFQNQDIQKYFGLSETTIFIDLFGPLIDISQIPDFHGVNSVRYLSEDDIANLLSQRFPRHQGWRREDILSRTLEVLSESKLRLQLLDKKIIEQVCRAKTFCSIKIVSGVPDKRLFDAARDLLIEYSQNFSCFQTSYIDDEYSSLDERDFKY